MWTIIGVILAIIFLLTVAIILFVKNKKDAQEWLLYAVAQAEISLGSETGELKLRSVYDEFIAKFPALSNFISFETFKKMVDKALTSLKDIIQNNEKIAQLLGQNKEG